MARYELPENIAQLHEAFGKKRLTGELKALSDKLRSFPDFKMYCKNARYMYGLTPRQLCLQFIMCQLLNPNIELGSANWLSGYFTWSDTVQGDKFWHRVSYGY